MKNKSVLLSMALAVCLYGWTSCGHSSQPAALISVSPEAGTTYKAGDPVLVQAHYPASVKADSVVFLLDSVKFGARKDSGAVTLKTGGIALGPRVITAKVFQGGKSQDISTNIVLLASHAPVAYGYKVVKVFPHDTSCYTEGLLYQDGVLYESGGGQSRPPAGEENLGQSSLRKVDLTTGKVLQKHMVDPSIFAEGISIIGDKIVQLTWKEKIGYVYDKTTFKLLKTFTNNVGVEGWGITFDGKTLYMDDSTNRIWFLDKDSFQQKGFIDVYDDKGPVNQINELEYIDGKIYANIYQTNTIIAIDPKTGAVVEKIDLTDLYPAASRNPHADVLNGIAYDAQTKRIFITGKKWNKLYQVAFTIK